MKQVNYTVIFMFLCCSFQLMAQNVGIGTSTPAAKLNIEGVPNNPSIPGTSSTGIFRIGVSNQESIDFGKQEASPYSAWIQAGFNGIATDPLAIQPLGGSVGMGTIAPHTSAALDISSNTKGLLPPRMTKVQRDAIASPAEGLMISCIDCSIKGLHQYINGAWQAMTSSNTGNYGTVTNPITGKTWLDRNLGATQVATSSTDAASYGDLYQWGRHDDGHQKRTSSTITSLATDFFYPNGWFIIGSSNWLSGAPAPTHMWSGTAAENNPCPSGFRIPTAAEWWQEINTWSTTNAAGAIASQLKIPMAGTRDNTNGSLSFVGSYGGYWSSTAIGTNAIEFSLGPGPVLYIYDFRARGCSIRCIKD